MDISSLAAFGTPIHSNPYVTTMEQVKKHRKKRINKKWLKRYGTKRVPCMGMVAGVLMVHPDLMDTIKKRLGPKPTDLYILAGSYQQAVYFAKEKGVPLDKLRYINKEQQLHGIDGKGLTLYYYGTAYRQKRSWEILATASHRGFNVEHIND